MGQHPGLTAMACAAALGTLAAPGGAGARTAKPAAGPGAPELRLTVTHRGPEVPWRYHLENASEAELLVADDPRLLWFEVELPGETEPVVCRLSDELFPDAPNPRSLVRLRSGASVSHRFDPRFYCHAAGAKDVLVPGAVVTARFGWPDQTRSVWKDGWRSVEILPPAPPFMVAVAPERRQDRPSRRFEAGDGSPAPDAKRRSARLLDLDEDAEPETNGNGNAATERSGDGDWRGGRRGRRRAAPPSPLTLLTSPPHGGETRRPAALRNVDGNSFTLGPGYEAWAGLPKVEPGRPVLEIVRGKDARDELLALVSVRLRNPTNERIQVFFRRELLRFGVLGPEGLVECAPGPVERVPSPDAFSTLRPGGSLTIQSRLVELCPRGTFARPGAYLVRARFDAVTDGAAFGMKAFAGSVEARDAVTLRIKRALDPEDAVAEPEPVPRVVRPEPREQ